MKRTLTLLAAMACLAGCGYTLTKAVGPIPQSVHTIYVARVDVRNRDLRAGDEIARELRGELRRRGRFEPALDESRADAVLEVRLVRDRARSAGFDEFDEALSYDTALVADARLLTSDGRELWSRQRIALARHHAAVAGAVVTSSSAFQSEERLDPRDLSAFDTVQVGENRRKVARAKLMAALAREIYAAMVGGL